MHRLKRLARWLVPALCLLWLAGCGVVAERSLDLLYPPEVPPVVTLTVPIPQPSESPAAAPAATAAEAVATAAQTPPELAVQATTAPTNTATLATVSTAQPSATALPTPSPSSTPQTIAPVALVYLQGETLYRGDPWGASPIPISAAPVAEALAFRDGMLAAAQGASVQVIDLVNGHRAVANLNAADVEYAELLWGSAGRSLVYGALAGNAQSNLGERHVELHILDASAIQNTGRLPILGRIILNDVQSVNLLRYDDEQHRLLLVPRGENPVFREIRFYDVASGQLVDTYPAEGQGDVLISPDGRYILTEQFTASGAQFALYDLQAKGEVRPRVFPHEKGAYSLFPFWSPDGSQVAYLLRRNQEGQSSEIEALGLWVLDLESGEARRILDEDAPLSSLVGWTSEGAHVLGRHEAGEGSYYYAVRPDGGDRRILLLPQKIRILGWMPFNPQAGGVDARQASERSVILSSSLSAQAGNPDAMAQFVAKIVLGQSAVADTDLASQVEEVLRQAGWPEDSLRPRLLRLADGVWAAQLPTGGVYLLRDGRAERVGSGQVLLDARLQDQALGLISATGEAARLQPIYEFLRLQEDGAWKVVWSSQAQPYWVSTDGVINFSAPGLDTLQVTGTSFGLDSEDPFWDECHACPHRRLSGTWTRQGDSYILQTALSAGASSESILWSLTARTPYALFHECLVRMSRDLIVDDLVADPQVLVQIQELGLLDLDKRFIPLQESADALVFEDLQSQVRYLASVQDQLIVNVEQMQP